MIDPPVVATGGAHKAHYSSTNDLLAYGLTMLLDSVVEPGEQKLPFEFILPTTALPSFEGLYAHVGWKIYAKANLRWTLDQHDSFYLRVLNQTIQPPAPISVENPETIPKLRIDLPRNAYEPGETVDGRATILQAGNFRSVRLNLTYVEYAKAMGVFTSAQKTVRRNIGLTLEIRRSDFEQDLSTTFQFVIPSSAPCSYSGMYSSLTYAVEATIDVPLSEDFHAIAPIVVAVKGKPGSTVPVGASVSAKEEQVTPSPTPPMPQSTLTTPETPPEIVEEVPAATGGSKPTDVESLILKALEDEGSKDLITISSEVQFRGENFIDLNQLRIICERLVQEGRLDRIGEGEFFATYRLKQPAP